MAAMEVELRQRKKGQVIQHRHISPPLPSSSQPAGAFSRYRDLLIVDSPSRRVVERRNRLTRNVDDFIEVEVLSSPPSRPKSPVDDEITLLSFEPFQQETSTVTPMALGGSNFRRKQIVPTDISSPVTVSATQDIDSPSIPLFDIEESIPPASSCSDSHNSILATAQREPLLSAPPLHSHRQTLKAFTSSGKVISISKKPEWKKIIASQEKQAAVKAQKEAYYGVDIHRLLDNIEATPTQSQTLTYFPTTPELTAETIVVHLEIPAKLSGQINTARRNSLTCSATNVFIATSCAG